MENNELDKENAAALAAQLITEEELNPADVDAVASTSSFARIMREYEKATGSTFAASPSELRAPLEFRRLQQLVNIALLNPMWRERLAGNGVTRMPETWEDWQRIPVCDKNSIVELFTGERKGMVLPLSRGGFEIVASGGTNSGIPSETVYSLRELADTYRIAGDFIGRYMLKPYLEDGNPKWLSTTLADYQMWSSGTMVGGVLQHVPGINYIGAGPVSPQVFHRMMSYTGDKAIMGISQSIALLPEMGESMPLDVRRSLKVAMYGSGVLSTKQRERLVSVYPNVSILSYFAATQAEAIGLQLDALSPYLTAVPGLHLVEIVDENGNWVSEGEEGELVVTRLHATEAPVLRFKVGDRMIRRPDLKTDTLNAFRFEFVGRSGEVIQIRDTQYPVNTVYQSVCREFQNAGLFNPDKIIHEYQFVNNRTCGYLQLLLEVDDPMGAYMAVADKCGCTGTYELFMRGLSGALSVFNQMEANLAYLKKTGYSFELKFVVKGSPEVFRSSVGKVPRLKDII